MDDQNQNNFTDLPLVEGGEQLPASNEAGQTSDEQVVEGASAPVAGGESLGNVPEGPQLPSASEQISDTDVTGEVKIDNSDSSTATAAYPGLSPSPADQATDSGVVGDEAPTPPISLPSVEQTNEPQATETEPNTGEQVAPPVIGAESEEQHFDQQ